MIQEFNNEVEARAISEPKVIWHNINKWVVYTGDDIPVKSQYESDLEIALKYTKLTTLKNMSPNQIITWVDNNIGNLPLTNITQANTKVNEIVDAVKTLAIAVSILAKRI